MRILMLDNEFPPKGGGMGTVNKALLEQFAAREDIAIDLITSALDDRCAEVQFSTRIRIYYVPVGLGNIHHASNVELFLYAWAAYRLARRMVRAKRYDFCFAWSAVPAGAVALALERRFGLPFMTWVSGPDIPGFEQRYDYLFPVLKPLLKAIWRRSRPLIAKCSEEVELIRSVAPDQAVEVIPNGVDLERFRPGPPVPDEGPLQIVCAARLIERKGQRQLIEAVQRLKAEGVEVCVRFLGDGDARAAYEDLARDLEVQDRVEFSGFVPPEDVPGELARAHVFVLPSFFEGMSLATLEAMAAGLPLILTKTAASGDLLVEQVNGFLFDWKDVDKLFRDLAWLSQNRQRMRVMGENSRRKAEAHSWERIGAAYFESFDHLVNGHRS